MLFLLENSEIYFFDLMKSHEKNSDSVNNNKKIYPIFHNKE